ncbi:hypothetical protein ID866_1217 [Astraeus odoratus]|nr:hypothetical protein ID866_1217 [Astraeus odoratus]
MPGLPSFIELMATLGLDDEPKSPTSCVFSRRARSGSCSSISSASSSNQNNSPTSPTFDLSFEASSRDLDFDRRHQPTRLRAARYTPYTSTGVS